MDWRKNSVQALLKIFKKKHLKITTQVSMCSVCMHVYVSVLVPGC